jgi:hypothetical protein
LIEQIQRAIANIEQIQRAIRKAKTHRTKLTTKQLSLQGMSSDKVRIFLNELITSNSRYLEVGVFKGSTFIAATYGNEPECAVAIDNFSQFNGNHQAFLDNCHDNGVTNFSLIEGNSFKLKKPPITDCNIYFYDGSHEEESQRLALTKFIGYMADQFVFIVDDWNSNQVKRGTRKGIADCDLHVLKEWELPARHNGDKEQWWNGLYVGLLMKS